MQFSEDDVDVVLTVSVDLLGDEIADEPTDEGGDGSPSGDREQPGTPLGLGIAGGVNADQKVVGAYPAVQHAVHYEQDREDKCPG